MKIRILFFIVSFFIVSPKVNIAQEMSQAESNRLALTCIENINPNKTGNFTIKETKEKMFEGRLSYRIINFNEGGSVIISGEKGLHPIIAYSKSGTFDEEYLCEGEKFWMERINHKIFNYRYKKEKLRMKLTSEDTNTTELLKSVTTSSSVSPLLESTGSSRWAGWGIYATAMPYENGKKCCVPLAMAQIMKYYKFPIQGSSSNSYLWYDNGTWTTLSKNFNEQWYDYKSKPFRLTYCGDGTTNCDEGSFDIIPGTTDEEIYEISKLIYDCGIAVEMRWHGENDTSYLSGTLGEPDDWAQSMEGYFNYSDQWIYLNSYFIAQNPEDFKDTVRNEIENGRPVLFACYTTTSGHAVVMDGFENDDYFHFAFGRGGADDFYYYLYSSDDDGEHAPLPYPNYYKATIGIEPECTSTANLNLNNITVSTTSNNEYHATNTINFSSSGSTFIVDGNGTTGGRATAQAGNTVNLNPGFEVKLGGEIFISMNECGIPNE